MISAEVECAGEPLILAVDSRVVDDGDDGYELTIANYRS